MSGTSVSVTSSETLDHSDQPSVLYARTEKKYDVLGSRRPKNCSQVCASPPADVQLVTVTRPDGVVELTSYEVMAAPFHHGLAHCTLRPRDGCETAGSTTPSTGAAGVRGAVAVQ